MRWIGLGAVGALLFSACDSSEGSQDARTGGTATSSSGGLAPNGGVTSTGGIASTGGNAPTPGNGGTPGSGGTTGGAATGGAVNTTGGRPASGGNARGGSSTGGTSSGGAATAGASSAGAATAECDLSSLTTSNNEAGIGAGCVDTSQAREIGACGANFCISRPLKDRWPPGQGFCSKHCESSSDCGTGFECCEPRTGAVCFPYEEHALLGSGCAERCATNHLNCPAEQICCERVGKLCISELCSNVCPG
jgi:hypothetical protein